MLLHFSKKNPDRIKQSPEIRPNPVTLAGAAETG
jgi:hypothetical protein